VKEERGEGKEQKRKRKDAKVSKTVSAEVAGSWRRQ
jgi:hypothetical protein